MRIEGSGGWEGGGCKFEGTFMAVSGSRQFPVKSVGQIT